MLILTAFILLYSVCRMRSTIKKISHAFPNERLMLVHVVNFIVWAILVTITVTLLTQSRRYLKAYEDMEVSPEVLEYLKITYW